MFEHFTFGAVAQLQQPDEVSASPTDCRFPSPISPPTSYFDDEYSSTQPPGMKDIVEGFASQSIRPNENEFPQRSLWNTLPSPDFSVDTDEDSTEEDISYHSTIRGKVSISSIKSMPNLLAQPSSSSMVANRRLRRQLNVQLQSCNKHIRDINALVEEMIESNNQCNLHTTTSKPGLVPPPSGREEMDQLALDTDFNSLEEQPRNVGIDEDEGFAEMDDDEYLSSLDSQVSLRRSSAPSGIRKYNLVKWRSSADCVANPLNGSSARRTVRSKPRMRKRKPKSVPEGLAV